MDKKHFEDRVAEIKRSIEANVLQHNQLLGHLGECQWHLDQLNEAEKKAAEEVVPAPIPDANIPA